MKSYQHLTRAALLIALCVVLGYLFLPLPNVEMITAGIFISGVWMGARYGFGIGLVAEFIYSTTNPMGFPLPPLLLAQILAMALVGWCGGALRTRLANRNYFTSRHWFNHLLLAIAGISLTFIYDLLTNLSYPLTAGFNYQQMLVTLSLGIPFALIHVTVNFLIFTLLVPVILVRFPLGRNP